ncbi:hypothetical protein [Streptomyces sp. NPDC003863]
MLSVLLHAGIGFHKSCCGGPGRRPTTVRGIKARTAHARRTGEPLARVLKRYDV